MSHLLHWLYANVWGNLVASALATGVGLTWHHRRVMARLSLHHDQQNQRHTALQAEVQRLRQALIKQ